MLMGLSQGIWKFPARYPKGFAKGQALLSGWVARSSIAQATPLALLELHDTSLGRIDMQTTPLREKRAHEALKAVRLATQRDKARKQQEKAK